MKFIFVLVVTSLLLTCGQSKQSTEFESSELSESNSSKDDQIDTLKVSISESFLDHLVNQKYEQASSFFDDILLEKLNSDQLETTWNQLQEQVGNYNSVLSISQSNVSEKKIIFQELSFESGTLFLKLVFNENNKIVGIFFTPQKV